MDRRKALATAGAITGTLMAATIAAAANFGLLGLGEHDSSEVGKLRATRIAEVVDDSGASATTTTTVAPGVEIRYEDVPVPAATTDDHSGDDQAEPDGAEATTSATTSEDANDSETVTSVDDHTDDGTHDAAETQHVDDQHPLEHEGAEDDD